MPSIVQTALKDRAVYWPRLVPDGFPNGGTTLPPVEIACRWIEGVDSREQQIESTVLVDRDLETGGFIRLGGLDELIPENTESYPPTTPAVLDEDFAYWKFDGDLLGDPASSTPDFGLSSGAVMYDAGAVDQAVFNDADDYSILTGTEVLWGGAGTSEVATVSLFCKLAEAVAGDAVLVGLDFGGFLLSLEAEKISCLGSEWVVPQGWSGSQFVSVILVLEAGNLPILYVGGAEIERTVDGANFVDIGNEFLQITTDLDDGNGFGSFGLDEMRLYRAVLNGREAQLLAGVHPNLYEDAEEILRFKGGNSINKKLRVRKIWLGGSGTGG